MHRRRERDFCEVRDLRPGDFLIPHDFLISSQAFRSRSCLIQHAPAYFTLASVLHFIDARYRAVLNTMVRAISICILNIFALIWVPHFVPMYSEIPVVRGRIENAILGFLTSFALLHFVYMLRVTVHVVRESMKDEPLIPMVQQTSKSETE